MRCKEGRRAREGGEFSLVTPVIPHCTRQWSDIFTIGFNESFHSRNLCGLPGDAKWRSTIEQTTIRGCANIFRDFSGAIRRNTGYNKNENGIQNDKEHFSPKILLMPNYYIVKKASAQTTAKIELKSHLDDLRNTKFNLNSIV